MSESVDLVAAQQVVQQSQHSQVDEFGQVATATAHAPDDISMSYVSKEVSQAMSYSVTADEMKSNAARIQSTTVTHAPVGAQDAHVLQANLRSRNPADDEPPEWKDDIYDEASKIRQVQSLKGETSGTSEVEPDLDKFEFPVAPVVAAGAAARPPPILKPRKPFLQALTLPNEQSPQPSPHDSEHGDSRRESPAMTSPAYAAHALMNKRPPKGLTRLKTRLQDPPPMTPAVSALVARGRVFSNSPDQDYPPLMTSRGLPSSRKVSVVGNLSRIASFAADTPGKLRSMASSLFTPQGGTASTPAGFMPPEEEVDFQPKPGC
jgi:hypothetical protein